jgi:AcrR family transcriptional regulator
MTPAPIATKTRILDAAEKLFGQNGFDATSLRDITAEAQVNLAAVNYHFQSKESLIDAAIIRRLEPVNRRRMEMLEAAEPSPSLEEIIEAFVSPVLDADMLRAVPMIGRVFSDPTQFAVRILGKHLAPVRRRFDEAFAAALPDLPAEERFWRVHFMAGAMTHLLAFWHMLPMMTPLPIQSIDRQEVVSRMVRFLAAGFRAPAIPEATAPGRINEERTGAEGMGERY